MMTRSVRIWRGPSLRSHIWFVDFFFFLDFWLVEKWDSMLHGNHSWSGGWSTQSTTRGQGAFYNQWSAQVIFSCFLVLVF
jgi:hypothetical protein